MKSRALLSLLPVSALVAFGGLLPGCSSDDNKSTNVVQTTEPFESGDLVGGATFVHTFSTSGTFGYRCRIHGGMSGTISVTPAGADSALVIITNNSFSAATPIKPGGYAHWFNQGSTHTVSRP